MSRPDFFALRYSQAEVVGRLCADALFSGALPTHGGLLEPGEALLHESELVRLVGVPSPEGGYWIYTDEDLSRYVGGIRIGYGLDALRRMLYENLRRDMPW